MTRKRTDFRALQARRDDALRRPELNRPGRPKPVDPSLIAAAVAAGRFTKLPVKRRPR